MLFKQTVGFIGGGNMAEAIIKGMINGGLPADRIIVADPLQERCTYLTNSLGVRCVTDNLQAAQIADLLILSIKPQVVSSALAALDTALSPEKLVISVMAGISTSMIEDSILHSARVVRAMPNTPALVQSGATAICGGRRTTDDDLALARQLFELVGTVCQVTEQQMDAVTGLSGSGPAYVYSFIEALADGGVKNGLPRDVAHSLVVQTVLGAAQLVQQSHEHPAILRDKVCSPGGTTIAALHSLENGRLHGLLMDAVDAAVKRSKELSGNKSV